MDTALMAFQVTAKEAAIAIALKDCAAVLTADPVTIADLSVVFAKHRDENIAGTTHRTCFPNALLVSGAYPSVFRKA
jgi:hypothetical protein